jgi:hypothetical protein
MAATPEAKVKDKIKKLLKKYGAYYTMPVMTGYATNGTPDFAICHYGRYLGLEAKAGDGVPTALQWVRLAEIDAAGGSTLVINEMNLGDLERWLETPQARVGVAKCTAKGTKAKWIHAWS